MDCVYSTSGVIIAFLSCIRRRSQSRVPVLPTIDIGNHGNRPYKSATLNEAILRQGDRASHLEQRLSTLELANKALLEEMMQIHTAVRSSECKCECRSFKGALRGISDELSQRVAHNEAIIDDQQVLVRELASGFRERGREWEARLTTDINSLKRLVSQMEVEKKNQDVWLKERCDIILLISVVNVFVCILHWMAYCMVFSPKDMTDLSFSPEL